MSQMPTPPSNPAGSRRPGVPMAGMRWVLISLTGVLGLVLIAHDNVVVGGLITALAFFRAMMLVSMQRRWRDAAAWRAPARGAQRRGGPPRP